MRVGFASFSCATLHDLAAHLPELQTLAGNITAGRTIRHALNIFQAEPLSYPKAPYLATLAIHKSWYDQR